MAQEPVFRSELDLADDLGETSVEAWREAAVASLKGRPLESLQRRTHEGIVVEPLYTEADGPVDETLPGMAPFTRGATADGGWRACVRYDHPDPAVVARQLAEDRARGAEAAWLVTDGGVRRGLEPDDPRAAAVGGDGIQLFAADQLELLLRAMDLPGTGLHLDGGGAAPALAAALAAAARRAGVDTAGLEGSLGVDPVGALVADGELPSSLDRGLGELAETAAWAGDRLPRMRSVVVSALPAQAGGASAVQALATALATGVAYLRAMEDAGVGPEDGCRQVLFRWALGRDLFMEIAALRALRWLWWRVADACGVTGEAAAARIHAVTSSRTLTVRDPWVNLLRGTGQGFAAVAGGADLVTVLPYDAAVGPPDGLGRRMALNTHTILREESHLDRIVDPAGGSWYVERLTCELAREAWRRLQAIETEGGIAALVRDGGLEAMLAPVREERRRAIATRRDPVTGVSTWPHLGEEQVRRPPADDAAVRSGIADAVDRVRRSGVAAEALATVTAARTDDVMAAAEEAAAAGGSIGQLAAALGRGTGPVHRPLLPTEREGAMFERLRDASDAFAVASGARPRAFLAAMGPLASYTARATFVANLLAAGGIETVDRGGFTTVVDAVDAFDGCDAAIAVLCAADDRYPEVVSELATRLKERGARRVLLAGQPGEHAAAWRSAGVDDFVHVGCDAHEVLSTLLLDLGVLS